MQENGKVEKLRKQIVNALSKERVDYSKVLTLSTELAKHDTSFVRFSVDAGIVNRLGRELVARQETAVAELIKNSYDAEAEMVSVIFSDAEKVGGQLEINDDGLGMSRDQLISGFMRLSSVEKINEPISPNYKRMRAGRKGIGRFAVQRLGESLEIITQTQESKTGLRVEIDWSKFEAGLDLSTVANRIEEIPKQKEQGTKLIIRKLRESWDETSIREVYQYISDLIQPFPLSKKNKRNRLDPGFKVSLSRKIGAAVQVIADEKTEILKYALAVIEGFVDGHGKGYWSLESGSLGINEPVLPIGADRENSSKPFQSLRNINFKAYYFIYGRAGLIPKSVNKAIQDLATTKGGIRVYRNGFRVRPYGDRDDDWLGLDESSRAREILPPHANNNFFGFVEIIDPEGQKFDETASRERLLENKAFSELQDFVASVLKSAALKVAEVRGRKRTASQKDWQKEKTSPAEKIKDAANRLATVVAETQNQSTGDVASLAEAYDNLLNVTKEVVVDLRGVAKVQEEVLEELGMLRVLATLGLIIGEFTHEINQTLGASYLSAKQLTWNLKRGSKEYKTAEDLRVNIERFKTYSSYFNSAIAANASRELAPQKLQLVIRRFIETIEPRAQRAGIKIEKPKSTSENFFTRPMHTSEWASILFNLFSNAQKAIVRAHSDGKVLFRYGRDDGKVYMEMADNGDGIPPENEERIFDAFFTTTRPTGRNATEEEELQGSGLGLKIVKDIVSSYNGAILLVKPPKGYSTCFRIEIPEATLEELIEYDY